MIRSYELIPAQRWCPRVDDVRVLKEGGDGLFVARPGHVETVDEPDLWVDRADVEGIGTGPSTRDFRITIGDAFLAAVNDVRIEAYGSVPVEANSYNVFVAPSLALGDTQHMTSTYAAMLREMGEAVAATAAVEGKTFDFQCHLYDDIEPERHYDGPMVLLASRFTNFNYFHWMLDLVPRLWGLELLGDTGELPLILPNRPLLPFQAEILAALGLRNPLVAPSARMTRVDRLYFPSFFAPGGYDRPMLRWLSQRLRAAFGVARPAPGSELIYVSREDAGWRRLINEDEILRRLVPLGFRKVVPSTLSVAEQARVFASARVVVAPHGAGNTNMLFAGPGTTLVEMVPAHVPNQSYYLLTKLNDQRYGRILDYAPTRPRGDIVIDADRLVRLVEMALER